MRIGVISDTHLRNITPEFQELFERYLSKVDLVVHAGDFTSQVVLDYLSERPFKAVAGNMDPYEIQSLLPQRLTFQVEAKRFGLIHGWGPPWDLAQRVKREFEGVDAVIFGHSHMPYCEFQDGILLFNPGTPWSQSRGKGDLKGTIGIIEVGKEIVGKILEV